MSTGISCLLQGSTGAGSAAELEQGSRRTGNELEQGQLQREEAAAGSAAEGRSWSSVCSRGEKLE